MKPARKKQELKKEYLKNKKNFLPTLMITGILWVLLSLIFFFIDPDHTGIVPIFLFTLFFACVFTFSLLLANTRRGVSISVAIVSYLVLALFGLGNLLNLTLIVGTLIAFEIYFYKNA